RFFIHRVVMRTDDGLITQGDALAQPDPPVDAADVLGRMVGHNRGNRALQLHAPRRLRMTRWLFGRSSLAARLFLRLQRIAPSKTA
ncbi:MAG TPA: hypothetical protein VK753_02205, partial [Xanthomonadaceae bacterium]|nr:hypothetical protein [Xanthomonadaceae bacterium]